MVEHPAPGRFGQPHACALDGADHALGHADHGTRLAAWMYTIAVALARARTLTLERERQSEWVRARLEGQP